MTIVQLEYILAVDRHRHFAWAAESCFVTQPTLSMQIQKLEEELGVLLFDRSKQPVVPTDIGLQIIEQARVVVYEAKKINEIIEYEKNEIAGELRLGVIPTLAPYLLPLFLQSFSTNYPKVKLHIQELLTSQIIEKLKNDQLDAGLVSLPLEETGIIEKHLFNEKFIAYISPSYKQYKEPMLDLDKANIAEIWLLNEGHCFREQSLKICSKMQKTKNSSNLYYESGSLESLKNLVDRQNGFTFLPELSTLFVSESDRHKLKNIINPEPVREIGIATHRSYLKRKILEALAKEVLNGLPENMKDKNRGITIKWK